MTSAMRIQILADARQALMQLNQLRGQLSAVQKVVNGFSQSSKNLATATNAMSAAQAKAAEAASKVAVAESKAEIAQSKAAEAAARAEVANNNVAISAERLAAAQSQSEVATAKVAAAQAQAAVASERLAVAQNSTQASAERLAAAQSAAESAAARVVTAENQAAASAERVTVAENAAATSAERLAAAKSATEAAASRAAAAENANAASAERLTAAENAAATSAERLDAAKNATAASSARLSAAENAEAASAERVTTSVNQASASYLRLQAAQERGAASALAAQGSLATWSQHLIKTGKDGQWLGRILTQNFTLPIALMTGLGAKWALGFETEVTQVRKVYGDLSMSQAEVNHDVDLMSKAFMALSNIFGVHAEEVAHIGAIWAQAGAQGTQLAKVTRSTIEAMLLGELDAETAANGLITLMTAYRLSSDELTQALATLNMVENETAIGFGGLLEVMQDSALVAKNAGVSIRELAALSAAVVPVAGDAAEAGNALKSIIPRVMVPNTKKAAEAFKSMGVDIKSTSFASATFTERLGMLSGGWKNLDQQTKLSFARDVFGLHQIDRGVAILDDLTNSQGSYAKSLDVTADASKNLAGYQRELSTLLQSDPQAFKIATNRLRNFLTQAVIPLLPAINSLVAGLVALTQWFSHLNPRIQQLVLVGVLLLALAGPLIQAFNLVKIMVGLVGSAAASAAKALLEMGVSGFLTYAAMALLVVVAGGLGYALGGLEGALWGVAAALVVIALVVGGLPAIIAAVVAVIGAAAYSIYKHWDQIPGFFSKLMQNIVKIVAKGVSFLPQSFQAALSSVLRVVVTIGKLIYRALSWLNPFARHSPSLVEQVLDGTAIISSAYAAVASSVARSMARVGNSVRALGAQIAQAKANAEAAALADDIKFGGMAGANPDTIRSLVAEISNMKAGADALSSDIKAQTDVVASWKDQLDAANKTLDLANDKLSDLKNVVSDLDDQISASKDRLSGWLDAPIAGTYAFEDAIFSNDQAQKALQLQIAQLTQQVLNAGFAVDDVRQYMDDQAKAASDAANANDGLNDSLANSGMTADETKQRMAELRTEIEGLHGAALELRLQGAGSDVLGGIQGQIAQSEAQRKTLAQTLGSGSSSSAPPVDAQNAVKQIDELQKALDKLSNQGQILDLEKALALEPAQKAIKDTQRIAEQSFEAILAGIQQETAAQAELNTRRTEAVNAVTAQQAAVDQLTASRDQLQATYDAENDKLGLLQSAYQSLEDQITTANDALEEAVKLGEDLQKALDDAAAAASGLTAGDFALPTGTGAGIGNEPMGDLQSLIDDLQKEAEKAFKNPFSGLKEKLDGWISPVKDKLNEFKDWTHGFFANLFSGDIGAKANDLATRIFGPDFTAKLKGGWDSAWSFLKQDIWGPIAANILPAVDRFIANMKEKFGPFIESLKNLWDSLGIAFGAMWAKYGPTIMTALGIVLDFIKLYLTGFLVFAGGIWDMFTKLVGIAIDAISLYLGGFISILTGIINIVAGILTGDWGRIWDGALQILKGILDIIGATVGAAFTALFTVVTGMLKATWDAVVAVWHAVGLPSFSGMWDWIQNNFVNKITELPGKIGSAFSGLASAVGGAFSGLKGAIAGGLNAAIGVINSFGSGVNKVASALGIGFRVGTISLLSSSQSESASVSVGGGAKLMASGGQMPQSEVGGGFVTSGARAIVGEGNSSYPEFVIPTDPRYRDRALMLATQLISKLGLASGGIIPKYASGGILNIATSIADKTATSIWDSTVNNTRNSMRSIGGLAGEMGRSVLDNLVVGTGNNVINKWLGQFFKDKAAAIAAAAKSALKTVTSVAIGGAGRFFESGGTVPQAPYAFADGAYVKGGHGGVTGKIGEGRKDEIVTPVDKFLEAVGNGKGREMHFHGDLVFPNVKNGDDAKAFIDNLVSLG